MSAISTWGYRLIWVKGRGYVREHRLVVEKFIGRELDRSEVVHHINGDKLDNRLENLEIISQSEHMKLHIKDTKAAYNKKFGQRWAWKYDKCEECGTTERKHTAEGLCVNCWHRGYLRKRRASCR